MDCLLSMSFAPERTINVWSGIDDQLLAESDSTASELDRTLSTPKTGTAVDAK